MGIPKRKTDIEVFGQPKKVTMRNNRLDLLKKIVDKDVYLPDSILHEDLDMGMLVFVKKNFVVNSNGEQIPIIPKILTIQRWSEFENNWEFTDDEHNIKLPFISVIRKPDVQPGSNPVVQKTIPERLNFYYSSKLTWDGNQLGGEVYKIPQPVIVDISYDVNIICNRFTDLNSFNQKVLQKFSSRQAYTQIKGHYIPIILESINDNNKIIEIDERRFFYQTYKFKMMGYLIDSNEFEVKPAINRMFIVNEFIDAKKQRKQINKSIDIEVVTLPGDGMQTSFSVGETIGMLFSVSINGLLQERDVNFYHIANTSKITFPSPPNDGSTIQITYYKNKKSFILDYSGKILNISTEHFTYDGSTLIFTLSNIISTVINVDINGLQQDETDGYDIEESNKIKLLYGPVLGSRIGITYLH